MSDIRFCRVTNMHSNVTENVCDKCGSDIRVFPNQHSDASAQPKPKQDKVKIRRIREVTVGAVTVTLDDDTFTIGTKDDCLLLQPEDYDRLFHALLALQPSSNEALAMLQKIERDNQIPF